MSNASISSSMSITSKAQHNLDSLAATELRGALAALPLLAASCSCERLSGDLKVYKRVAGCARNASSRVAMEPMVRIMLLEI